MIPAAVAGAAFGPLTCNEIYGCSGGFTSTQVFLLAAGLGAIVGVVGMAVVDVVVHGRYASANRREQKRRRRAEAQRQPFDSGSQ